MRILEEQIAAWTGPLASESVSVQPTEACRTAQIGVSTMTVKMEHVIGLAFVFGLSQIPSQLVERGRPEKVQLETGASILTKATYDSAGYRPERHVLVSAGPTYGQQYAYRAIACLWFFGRHSCLAIGSHEGDCTECRG